MNKPSHTMNSSNGILSKENSQILRGLAIVSIMLHNFLHVSKFGLSQENEMSFSSDKVEYFFSTITSGGGIAEVLSFLGWIGVPVFIFLTGYGVSFSHPNNKKDYLWRNYLKLLVLMLPAILFFMVIDISHHDIWPGLMKRFTYLTMLANFAYPFVECTPGVYWYFGLTFQFYVIWAYCVPRQDIIGKKLLICSVILLLGLYILCKLNSEIFLSIYRHSFTGWFFIFVIGILVGKNKKIIDSINIPWWAELLLTIVLFGLVIIMNKWLVTWLLVPLIALAMFFFAGKMLMRTKVLSSVFKWIGLYSAAIFVCHPIARRIMYHTNFSSLALTVLVYIGITMILAIGYNWFYKWTLGKILPQKKDD